MPRPIEYEKEQVLDRALAAFWRLGYGACSFQILVQETGMNRQSLYNAFGTKEALFQTVLAHYKAKVAQQLTPLEDPQAGLDSLRRFIEESLDIQRSAGPGACFLVVTAFGPQASDPKVRQAVDAGASMVRTAFAAVLVRVYGEKDTAHSATTAAYLYSLMNGLSALAKTGGHPSQVAASLTMAFQSIAQKASQ